MSDNDTMAVDFIKRLADLNLYIVVEGVVQHAGYEATVNMLCVSKVRLTGSFTLQITTLLITFSHLGMESCSDGHWTVEAASETEAQ